MHDNLVDQIRSGNAGFIDKRSHRLSRFWVLYDGVSYPVVYDRARKIIVSVMLREWIETV